MDFIREVLHFHLVNVVFALLELKAKLIINILVTTNNMIEKGQIDLN